MNTPTESTFDPSTAWREAYAKASVANPSARACVASAILLADQVWRQGADPGAIGVAVADQASWSRTALAAYLHLADTRAYAHRDTAAQLRCWADPNVLRDWLTGPSTLPGFDTATVAETWNITDDDFAWDGNHIGPHMATLIDQAQKAGVYGVAGYTISLRHLTTDDPDDPDNDPIPIIEHQVTLHTPSGAVLASAPIAADHLADDDLSGVDAAVVVLYNAAITVNELLTAETRIAASAYTATAEHQHPPRPARGLRGFAPLDLINAATPSPAPMKPVGGQSPRGPHR